MNHSPRFGTRRTNILPALLLAGISLAGVNSARADQPPPEKFRERIPVEQPAAPKQEVSQKVVEEGGWGVRLAPGVTTYFFSDESNLPAPALYMDVFNRDWPLNFRMGVEGRHMFLSQDEAAAASDGPGRTPRITYIRIPFALEYVMPVAENTKLFLGGGPDIVHVANDIEDTTVGGHLGGRLQQNFDEHWGVAVEGGYMWAEVDGDNNVKNVSLDGAYITPTLTYTF